MTTRRRACGGRPRSPARRSARHTTAAAAFYAAAALLLTRGRHRRAVPILAGIAAGIAVAVAASRVLLGVHWVTDTLGGLALGWGWVAVCAVIFAGRLLRHDAAAPNVGGAYAG